MTDRDEVLTSQHIAYPEIKQVLKGSCMST